MLKNILIVLFITLRVDLFAQPNIVQQSGTLNAPLVLMNLNTPNQTVVYRSDLEIIFKPGFEVTQTGNTTGKFFLGYINVPRPVYYAELKEELDDSYAYTFNSKLAFKYEEKNAVAVNTLVSFVIYNASYQQMATPGGLTKNYGNNYLVLDLVGYDFSQNQYYIMEITNEKGEKRFLRFKFQV
ncbi:hypothetical protein [Cytophaga hutchinsonii]|uniref:Uncharacterized protein n=1 Tax=Cytophaga hutchinsonii (strain ATCC 33406 / DSM 1761 / CIP 103989 / NBRC 15051 / NCIMB 9469 / D465) TaxID=269798 RepID=A0A6N4SVG6_CYTH3|nr:hypothetical protein [Cytophaga hutchinsonii]ABG60452.1 hypothetical protein CHU_3212 [Cytophaga hutchinsonii ATCC 33406]SFX85660.1 hypothetical protein SAMN04487930_11167 [Cytophaga hutchinsonii ATCC 33406]